MKKLILLSACIVLNYCALAQSKIKYVFPKSVEKSLAAYFERTRNTNVYLVLDQSGPIDYSLTVGQFSKKADALVDNANRFVEISGKNIPIVLYIDYAFLSHGTGTNGSPIRHTIIHEGYTISFNYYGQIAREGY